MSPLDHRCAVRLAIPRRRKNICWHYPSKLKKKKKGMGLVPTSRIPTKNKPDAGYHFACTKRIKLDVQCNSTPLECTITVMNTFQNKYTSDSVNQNSVLVIHAVVICIPARTASYLHWLHCSDVVTVSSFELVIIQLRLLKYTCLSLWDFLEAQHDLMH